MKLLASLALISIAVAAASRVSKIHGHRTGARPKSKPSEVQTWEGEGGGLPTGGPGPGVRVSHAAQADPELVPGDVGLVG